MAKQKKIVEKKLKDITIGEIISMCINRDPVVPGSTYNCPDCPFEKSICNGDYFSDMDPEQIIQLEIYEDTGGE